MPVTNSDTNAREIESAADRQRDIKTALRQYCQFPHPQGFAVMLRGVWGSGKTHFIKSIADDLAGGEKQHKPLYVSLYGVSDASEIGDQLFQQLHPVLSHKATRLVGAILRSAAKATIKFDLAHAASVSGALPDVDLSSMLSGSKGRIIIFDDLERAIMTPVAVLGYINPLVEHDDCKVVILADESRITKDDAYWSRKEKTVGRTFEFIGDPDAAYAEFMKLIDEDEARAFLTESKSTVLQVFAESGLGNLRLLKQALWDFERLWMVLTPEQRQHKDAMKELVSLLCASSIELRSGGLTAETFRRNDYSLYFAMHARERNEQAEAIDSIFKKYHSVRFDSTLLETDTIVDMVLRSLFSSRHIQAQLHQHPYFKKPSEMPSWRALWLIGDASVEEHDEILRRYEDDFAKRTYRSKTEINHIIGLSLWLTELGVTGWTGNDGVDKVKQYIDDVYAEGHAPLDEISESSWDDRHGGASGLGYRNTQDANFDVLVKYHELKRSEWRQRAYPAIAAHLRRLIAEDGETFLREVCFTAGGSARYARVGVLKEIAPDQFAEAVARTSLANKRKVLMALSIRYQQVIAESELEAEVPWLCDVQQRLEIEVGKLPTFARFELSGLVQRYVDDTLAKVNQILGKRVPRDDAAANGQT